MKTVFTLLLATLVFSGINAQNSDCFEECFFDPEAICIFLFDPVCGCDGQEYSNSCIALTNGIPSWTTGSCAGNTCFNELSITSEFESGFGTDDIPQSYAEETYCFNFESALPVGENPIFSWTTSDGQSASTPQACFSFQTISDGESVNELYTITLSISSANCTFVHNVKFQPGLVDGDDCLDLSNIDFGDCELLLGVALVNNTCSFVSGCSTLGSDNLDYSEYFFENIEDCEEVCGSCINQDQIDPETICPAVIDPVCGCDGVTYNNSCEAENWFGVTSYIPGPCKLQNAEPCDDLAGIDFGPCDLVLGAGIVNGLCATLSGCETVVEGVDYSEAIFDTMFECVECDQNQCINEQQIDPNYGCDDVFDPVCGCDSITYSNSCEAIISGVTSWEDGECNFNSVNEIEGRPIEIYPNPTSDILKLSFPEPRSGRIELLDEVGRSVHYIQVVEESEVFINTERINNGIYFLIIREKSAIDRLGRVIVMR